MVNSECIEAVEALIAVYYYSAELPKKMTERLKASKHLTEAGKVSDLGCKFIDRWFARGADRIALVREL